MCTFWFDINIIFISAGFESGENSHSLGDFLKGNRSKWEFLDSNERSAIALKAPQNAPIIYVGAFEKVHRICLLFKRNPSCI